MGYGCLMIMQMISWVMKVLTNRNDYIYSMQLPWRLTSMLSKIKKKWNYPYLYPTGLWMLRLIVCYYQQYSKHIIKTSLDCLFWYLLILITCLMIIIKSFILCLDERDFFHWCAIHVMWICSSLVQMVFLHVNVKEWNYINWRIWYCVRQLEKSTQRSSKGWRFSVQITC